MAGGSDGRERGTTDRESAGRRNIKYENRTHREIARNAITGRQLGRLCAEKLCALFFESLSGICTTLRLTSCTSHEWCMKFVMCFTHAVRNFQRPAHRSPPLSWLGCQTLWCGLRLDFHGLVVRYRELWDDRRRRVAFALAALPVRSFCGTMAAPDEQGSL
jgi:hypothetical protein